MFFILVPELKRGTSKTDLKRQLSKQTSIVSLVEKKDPEKDNERSKLIAKEDVKTGSVRPYTCTV